MKFILKIKSLIKAEGYYLPVGILDFIHNKHIQQRKFNQDIIYNYRKMDNFVDYLNDIFQALETIKYIKFHQDKTKIITDESQFIKPKLMTTENRMNLLIFYFTITYKDKVEEIKLPLYVPKLIDKYFYILNGVKYYPIYQNVDSASYNTKNAIILKSLLMPIIIKKESKKITDYDGTDYVNNVYQVVLFKHTINILYYFFAKYGYEETLNLFGFNEYIKIVKNTKYPEKYFYFKIGKSYYVKVRKEKMKEKNFKDFVACLVDILNRKYDKDKIHDIMFWKLKLGAIYTKNINNQLDKAETVICSFERILDNRTKKNLYLLKDDDKENIFKLIRWMVFNFEKLINTDNFDLDNKRLRFVEYMVTPFTKKMSNNTYRILNSRNVTINKLKGIFRISPMIIIDDIKHSDLVRYDNAVNDQDLFNVAIKISSRGPASLGSAQKSTISMQYRGIHYSQVGRWGLTLASSNDPGLTGVLCPYVKMNGFFYKLPSKKNKKN